MEILMTTSLVLIIMMIGMFSCLEIVRDYTGDQLSCSNPIDCTRYGSKQLDNTTCGCNGGTFFKMKDGLKCLKQAKTEDCNFTFSDFEEDVMTISVEKGPADEFYENIVSTDIKCYKMSFRSAQYLDEHFQWSDFPERGFSMVTSASTKSYIKWVNQFRVNKTMYSGQLIKFRIYCKSLSSKDTINGCLYGKIIGSRLWNNENIDVCDPVTTTPPSKDNTNKKTPQKDDNTDMLVGAIIATILLVILIVVILIFCIRRKRITKYPSDQDVRIPAMSNQQPTSDYIEPNSLFDQNDDDVKSEGNHHVEFENKAYLTKLRPTTNNNSNDVNYDQPFHSDEASFLPQSTKQNRTSAKPVVSTTTNNIYEPIFGDYEYPGDIKPDEKTSYTNLGEIDSGTLQYHTLNNSSPSQGNDGEAYIDMNSGEV